jgi:hypothetical protein
MAGRWAGATPACTCRPTWPKTAPRWTGWPSCFRRRAATWTSTPQHGLLHERAVLAHGIWLDARPRTAARQRCTDRLLPQQQPVPGQRAVRLASSRGRGHRVSLASDVGGGTSLSMLRTLADGLQGAGAARQRACRPGPCCTPPPAARPKAWAWATRSAPGHRRLADVVVWDWAHGPVARTVTPSPAAPCRVACAGSPA